MAYIVRSIHEYSRCSNWGAGGQCPRAPDGWLVSYAADGELCMAAPDCRTCAERIIAEYNRYELHRERGERWGFVQASWQTEIQTRNRVAYYDNSRLAFGVEGMEPQPVHWEQSAEETNLCPQETRPQPSPRPSPTPSSGITSRKRTPFWPGYIGSRR